METKFKAGETVYLISNSHFIEEATVVMTISGFVTIRFTQRGGGTRVRENRLYATQEEAETAINDKSVDEQTGNLLYSVGRGRHLSASQIADILRHLRAGICQFSLDSALPLLQSGKHVGRINDIAVHD